MHGCGGPELAAAPLCDDVADDSRVDARWAFSTFTMASPVSACPDEAAHRALQSPPAPPTSGPVLAALSLGHLRHWRPSLGPLLAIDDLLAGDRPLTCGPFSHSPTVPACLLACWLAAHTRDSSSPILPRPCPHLPAARRLTSHSRPPRAKAVLLPCCPASQSTCDLSSTPTTPLHHPRRGPHVTLRLCAPSQLSPAPAH